MFKTKKHKWAARPNMKWVRPSNSDSQLSVLSQTSEKQRSEPIPSTSQSKIYSSKRPSVTESGNSSRETVPKPDPLEIQQGISSNHVFPNIIRHNSERSGAKPVVQPIKYIGNSNSSSKKFATKYSLRRNNPTSQGASNQTSQLPDHILPHSVQNRNSGPPQNSSVASKKFVSKYSLRKIDAASKSFQTEMVPKSDSRSAPLRTFPVKPTKITEEFSKLAKLQTTHKPLSLQKSRFKIVRNHSNYHKSKVQSPAAIATRFRLVRRRLSSEKTVPLKRLSSSRYSVSRDGKTLRRITTEKALGPQKNERAVKIMGSTFIRKGSVYKWDRNVEYSQKRAQIAVKKSRRSSLALNLTQKKTERRNCMFFTRYGRCPKKTKCPFVHDPLKVAICARFLRGNCSLSNCTFSHEITPDRMPICKFFEEARCFRDNCQFLHVKHSDSTPVCKSFQLGYCSRGKTCPKKHYLPSFEDKTWKPKKTAAEKSLSKQKLDSEKTFTLTQRKPVGPTVPKKDPFDELEDVILLDPSSSEDEEDNEDIIKLT